jgi:ADP-heptose:LPS heptosyltransferase
MILVPALSRDFKITDFIVENAKSKLKIGFMPDSSNMNFIERKISMLIYTKSIEPNPDVKFEFFRNNEFFSAALENTKLKVNFGIESAKIGPIKDHLNLHPYIFIFAGGSSGYKRWPLENYIELIQLLNLEFKGYSFIFLGNPDEKFKINSLVKKNSINNIVNITGEYSLVEIGSILSESELIISNDSFIPHLSVAHNKNVPVLVLYAGYHYGRFLPYPEILSKCHYVINANDRHNNQPQKKIESITAKTAFNTITSLDLIPRIAQN